MVETFPGTTVATVEPTVALRIWLQKRIDVIIATPGAGRRSKPVGPFTTCPRCVSWRRISGEQLAAIEHLLDDVEAHHRMSFPDERPDGVQTEGPSNVLDLFPTQPSQEKRQ